MKAPEANTVDFETLGIEERPDYPPIPVGVSIEEHGKKPRYYAWAHPTKNNCTKKEAIAALKKVWDKRKKTPLLFHHAKFDIDVAETHLGMEPVRWDEFHDTQFLLFLDDPHAESHSLKPSAERVLGMKPEERDAVKDWILKNKAWIEEYVGHKFKDSEWGAYIAFAPGDLVGKYANGDVVRTTKLFKKLWPQIVKDGMQEAYDRERKIMPIFLENERVGMRVDLKALERDIPMYYKQLAKAEAWLRKRLKIDNKDFTDKNNPDGFNFDSDAHVARALDEAGIVTQWTTTKTGKKSVSKKNMTVDTFNDKKVFLVLGYRNRLCTCLRMFMEPWLRKGKANKGYIHTNWNQVRQPKGEDGKKGTRTGRPSSDNPNFLNLSKSFEDRGDDYTHPKFIALEPLPLVREYILADEGCTWLHRDYNQQELRILAHFEDGAIKEAYNENPRMDIHDFVKQEIKRIAHMDADRVSVKTMNFGKIYGQGMPSLALKLRRPVEEVKQIRDAQNKALPGLPDLEKEIKNLAKGGEPIVTWGGRIYFVEPPKYVEKFKREMTFEYKLLNYLIQGSAADATKEAIIRYYYNEDCSDVNPRRQGRFVVTVYDEINICAPKAKAKSEMALLKECMEGLEFDVPMLTDGKTGPRWGELTKEK